MDDNNEFTRRHSSADNLKSDYLVKIAKSYISLIKRGLSPTTTFVKGSGYDLLRKHPKLCQEKVDYYKKIDEFCPQPKRKEIIKNISKILNINPDRRFDVALIMTYPEGGSMKHEWITIGSMRNSL